MVIHGNSRQLSAVHWNLYQFTAQFFKPHNLYKLRQNKSPQIHANTEIRSKIQRVIVFAMVALFHIFETMEI